MNAIKNRIKKIEKEDIPFRNKALRKSLHLLFTGILALIGSLLLMAMSWATFNDSLFEENVLLIIVSIPLSAIMYAMTAFLFFAASITIISGITTFFWGKRLDFTKVFK